MVVNVSNNDLMEMLKSLESKIDNVKDLCLTKVTELQSEVTNLKETVVSQDTKIQLLNDSVNELREKFKVVENNLVILQDKNLKLEGHGRRLSVILNNVKETDGEDKTTCEEKIRDILVNNLGFSNEEMEQVRLRDCHRLPLSRRINTSSSEKKARPIIVAFTQMSDRNKVMNNAYMLKNTKINIKSDLPKEWDDIRNSLLMERKKLIAQHESARVVERSYKPVLQVKQGDKWINY